MSEIILHHYDISPFAEKIRLCLGFKNAAWRSVIQPMVLPKPELAPLTGGFRRIPVLQIGADIYCDTNRIALEIERRSPGPTLYPEGRVAETEIWCQWAENVLMWPTARYVTAVNDDRLGAAFHADRAAMRGHPPPTTAELTASIPIQREHCRALLAVLEGVLGDGRKALLGADLGLADFAVYQRIWWLRSFAGRAGDVLEPFEAINEWAGRVAAIGHGRRTEMPANEALDIARAAEPDVAQMIHDDRKQPDRIGRRGTIGTAGFAADVTPGTVAGIAGNSISLRRADAELGNLMVHFPRIGYEFHECE